MFKLLFSLTMMLALFAQASSQTAPPPSQPGAPPLLEGRSGETLTDTLKRNDGVIEPPPVDSQMTVQPPAVQSRTPVIEPPPPGQARPDPQQ